jgi:hypothetical protein
VVSVVGAGVSHAKVEVRLLGRPNPGRADVADPLAGRHPLALPHRDGREVEVGGVVAAVGGANAHGDARRPGHAGEADLAGGRGHDRRPHLARDVDAAVLAAGVWIVAVPIRRDHLAVEGPHPRGPRWWSGQDEGEEDRGWNEDEATHGGDRRREGPKGERGRDELSQSVAGM